jgi:hypothetical protein
MSGFGLIPVFRVPPGKVADVPNADNSPVVWDDGHQPAWLSFWQTLYRKPAFDGVRTESINVHDVVVIEREAMRVHASSW